MQCFADGLAAGRRGLTPAQRRYKTYKANLKRAAEFGEEILQNNFTPNRLKTFILKAGIHRPQDTEYQKRDTGPTRKLPICVFETNGDPPKVEEFLRIIF